MRRQPFNSLRWRIYVFNSVVNTKLPAKLSHRRSTTVSLEIYPIYSFIMKQVCVLEVRSLGSRLNGGPSLIVFFPWDLSYFQNVRAGVARELTKSFGFHSWTSHCFVFWDKDTLLLQCQSPWQNHHLVQPRQVGISVAWWCKHWNKLHISWEPQGLRSDFAAVIHW